MRVGLATYKHRDIDPFYYVFPGSVISVVAAFGLIPLIMTMPVIGTVLAVALYGTFAYMLGCTLLNGKKRGLGAWDVGWIYPTVKSSKQTSIERIERQIEKVEATLAGLPADDPDINTLEAVRDELNTALKYKYMSDVNKWKMKVIKDSQKLAQKELR